jgi:hypothetical protein
LRVPASMIALAGLALSALVHIASMRGADVASAWPSVWLLHYALFPVVLVAVLAASAASGGERLSLRGFLALLPAWALALLAAGFIYAVATFAILVPATGAGDPVVQEGRVFFNDHGVIREVSGEQFRVQRALSLRLYSSVWLYVYLFAVVYLLSAKPNNQRLGRRS